MTQATETTQAIELTPAIQKAIEETARQVIYQYMDGFFNSPVALNSFAANMFQMAGKNLIETIERSSQRAPLMVVLNNYIEGSYKVTMHEVSSAENDFLVTVWTKDKEEDLWEEVDLPTETKKVIKTTLLAHNADVNKTYYLYDDVSLEQKLKQDSSIISSVLKFNTPGQ